MTKTISLLKILLYSGSLRESQSRYANSVFNVIQLL